MARRVVIPFKQRSYQKPLVDYILGGGKRAFVEWHRRAGKDLVLWNLMVRMATEDRKGLYFYFLPTYTQGKKIIWDGQTNDGLKFIDFIPKEIIKSKNSTEMKIELINGSIIQIIGTDAYDAIRGTNPVGCVFSEYAFQNPMAWDIVKPILRINGGWAVFNTTPNGKNHAYDMFLMSKDNPNWFNEVLTVDDTGLVTKEEIHQEISEGMLPEMAQQEYYCSHEIGGVGSVYGEQLRKNRGKVCELEYDETLPVDVWMDLGKGDATSIGFVQQFGKEIRIIDAFEANMKDIDYYIVEIKRKPYTIRNIYLPHDAFAKRLESKYTIAEQFEKHFNVIRVPKSDLLNGINRVRKLFHRMWFNKSKTEHLVRCLENYGYEYDVVKKVFRPVPKHDWTSHAADMIRYMAVSIDDEEPTDMAAYEKAVNDLLPKKDPANIDDLNEYLKAVDDLMN